MIPVLGDILREVGQTVRQVIPDPVKQREFDLKFAELADRADARDNELLQGQIEVNKTEAASANLFVAGWRPYIGWTGGVALGYTWIVAPLLKLGFDAAGIGVELPALDPNAIYPIILAMLGVGAMRTVEKLNGVATSVGGKVLTPVSKVPGPAPVQSTTPAVSPEEVEQPKQRKKWF
jgi:hypothetical protein